MKRVLALLLALVMVFALCACGDSTAPAADPTEAPAEATPEATEAHVVSEETAAVLSKKTCRRVCGSRFYNYYCFYRTCTASGSKRRRHFSPTA